MNYIELVERSGISWKAGPLPGGEHELFDATSGPASLHKATSWGEF
jgi:hypothetical protein